MDWVTFGAQWLHVLLGITWFGYSISMYYLVGPAISNMSVDAQREANSHLGRLAARVFPVVGSLVLLLGVIRGTLLGPIDALADLWSTTYGITWTVALVATIALFVTGARLIGPGYEGLRTASDFPAAVARLRRVLTIDLGLFAVVFTCMILMRFGH